MATAVKDLLKEPRMKGVRGVTGCPAGLATPKPRRWTMWSPWTMPNARPGMWASCIWAVTYLSIPAKSGGWVCEKACAGKGWRLSARKLSSPHVTMTRYTCAFDRLGDRGKKLALKCRLREEENIWLTVSRTARPRPTETLKRQDCPCPERCPFNRRGPRRHLPSLLLSCCCRPVMTTSSPSSFAVCCSRCLELSMPLSFLKNHFHELVLPTSHGTSFQKGEPFLDPSIEDSELKHIPRRRGCHEVSLKS